MQVIKSSNARTSFITSSPVGLMFIFIASRLLYQVVLKLTLNTNNYHYKITPQAIGRKVLLRK
jgi:hypothetical protein